MTVRELIGELLEYEMDNEVEIQLNLNNETYEDNFEVQLDRAPFDVPSNKIFLKADLLDQTLVGSEEYERMEDRLDELEGS